MFAHKVRRGAMVVLTVATAAATAGCFRSTAPSGWLPKPENAPRQAFGSWIRLEDRPGTPSTVIEGELIAVDADTVHVLFDRLVSLPRASFCCITVTVFDMNHAPLTWWGLAGALSTASHGIGLILTAPVWAIATTAAATSASRAPRIRSTDPAALRPYARFPQGIPPGLDRATLRSKPWALPGEPQLRQ